MRADMGTENSLLAKSHIAFRLKHNDELSGDKSFIYGPSTGNVVCFIMITRLHGLNNHFNLICRELKHCGLSLENR